MTRPLTSAHPLREALGRGSGIVATAFALSFVFALFGLAGPMFMLLIFDRVLPARSEETLVALFILVTVLLAMLALVDYARRRILARFGARFQELLEDRLCDTAGRAAWFPRGGRRPVPGLDDLDALRGFFHSGAMIAVLDVFWAPMFVVAIFILHPGLGWVALAGMALLVALAVLRGLTAQGRERATRAAQDRVGALHEVAAAGRGTLRGQEMAAGFRDRWLAARRQSRDQSLALRDLTTWFSVTARQVQGLARYAVMAFGAWLVLQGQITVGAMVAATFLAARAINPLDTFLDEAPLILRSLGHWSALRKVLDGRGPAPVAALTPDLPQAGLPVLALERVTVRSPATGATALNTLNLVLAPGSVTEITGSSGSGKTLLAEVMLGLSPVASGQVLFRGAPLSQLSPAAARRAFGYVPEDTGLAASTIADNIARLDDTVGEDAIHAAARAARVHDFIIGLPDGYATRLQAGERAFSRGLRAQIALARALCGMPDLLVIDAPDPVLRRLLHRDMRPMLEEMKARGAAVVVLSREPLSLRATTQAFVLDGPRLREAQPAAQASDPKVAPLLRSK